MIDYYFNDFYSIQWYIELIEKSNVIVEFELLTLRAPRQPWVQYHSLLSEGKWSLPYWYVCYP